MYCAACGVAVPQDLNYCNHCGARVGGGMYDGSNKQNNQALDSLIWAIVGVFVCGLGGLIGLIAVMRNYGLNDGLVNAFALSVFAFMLVIEAVFIGLLLKKSGLREAKLSKRLKQKQTKELEATEQRALPEHLVSVTENTTRAFEPVFRERKSDQV